MIDKKTGVIGAGRMATALAGGIVRAGLIKAENLSAAELVAFLEQRGKFVPAGEGGFNTEAERICNHS